MNRPITISREGMIRLIAEQLPQQPAERWQNLEKAVRSHFATQSGSDRVGLGELKSIMARVDAHTQRVLHTAAGYDAQTQEATREVANAFSEAVALWVKDPGCTEPKVERTALPPAKPSVPRAFSAKPSRRIKHAERASQAVAEATPPAPVEAPAAPAPQTTIAGPRVLGKPKESAPLQRPEQAIAAAYKAGWEQLEAACKPTLKFPLRTLADLNSAQHTLRWPEERFDALMARIEQGAREHGVWTKIRKPLADIQSLHREGLPSREAQPTTLR